MSGETNQNQAPMPGVAPGQVPGQPQKKTNVKLIVTIIVSAVVAIALIAGGGSAWWYLSGNIDGHYRATSIEKEFTKELEKEDNPYSEYITFKVDVTIENGKAVAKESITVDRDGMYQAAKEEADSYGMEVESKSKFKKEFDESMEESAKEDGGKYDSDTGTATLTAFEGKVNPWSRTLTITKEFDGDDLVSTDKSSKKDIFKKGKGYDYKKTSSGVTLDGKKTVELEKK